MSNELQAIQKEIHSHREELTGKYYVGKIGIFGSVAKGNSRPTGDIDVLVEFSKPVDLFLFAGLKLFLEQLLNKKVDLTTPRALKLLIRDEILETTVYL